MRLLFLSLLFISSHTYSQWKSYTIGVKGDTLNRVDKKDFKQGQWVTHFDEIRGEPGHEEEGEYRDNKKEGPWRLYTLQGDLAGVENYRWGNKDGVCQYFSSSGALIKEESWKALNPYQQYDTLVIEDIDHLDHYKTVIVKNDGVAIRHGQWKYYDPTTGMIIKTETYEAGKLNIPKATAYNQSGDSARSKVKPKEVMDFEKKNSGKKKVRVQDGSVH
jgi:antitoxin component YwqK of YwqJK toxin-antitoxin module